MNLGGISYDIIRKLIIMMIFQEKADKIIDSYI